MNWLDIKLVWNRSKDVTGVATGGSYHCQLEGCMGLRIAVRWPDGKMTYPCTKGMIEFKPGEWQIL